MEVLSWTGYSSQKSWRITAAFCGPEDYGGVAGGAFEMIQIPQIINCRARDKLAGVALNRERKMIGEAAVVIVMFEVRSSGFLKGGQNQKKFWWWGGFHRVKGFPPHAAKDPSSLHYDATRFAIRDKDWTRSIKFVFNKFFGHKMFTKLCRTYDKVWSSSFSTICRI